MKSLIFASKWIVAVALVFGLVGCASATNGNSAGKSNQVTLHVLLAANPETQILKKSIPEFEKQTGIKVALTEVPVDSLSTKLSVATNSGNNSVDIAGFQYEWIPKYYTKLLTIENYISQQDKQDFLPTAIDAATYKGHQYGQLYVTTGMILFYRKDLFQEKGIKVPTTWEEYVDAAKKLTSTNPETWGTIVTAKPAEEPVGSFLNYLYQAGGDVLDKNNNVIVNKPEAVKAMQLMVDLVNKDKVAPPGAVNYWTVDTTNLFKEGKLAMAPNWSYMYSVGEANDSKVKGKVGMALLPGDKNNDISLGGWTLSIFKNTKYPKEAYKFVQFMTNAKAQKIMALDGGNTPSRQSVIKDPEVSSNPLFPIMFEALKHSVSRSKYPNYEQIQSELSTAMSAAVSKTKTPQEALDDAAKNIKNDLENSGK